jgi:hypothetical protein
MKKNPAKFLVTSAGAFAAMSASAQNHATIQRSFSDHDLNAALGISDAWIWLQNSIVPLAMLAVFLGAIIIIAELHYRQNKMLNEMLRRLAETNQSNPKSTRG